MSEMNLDLSPKAMAKYIDHTILKPDASLAQVKKVCDEAKEYNFASVCVNTGYVKFVACEALRRRRFPSWSMHHRSEGV